MDELTREFLIESQEGLDRMERCLTALEERPQDSGLLGEIFRSVHTIKGATGFLGFSRLESLAHHGENLLGLLREGKLLANQPIVSALLALLDGLRAILRNIECAGDEGHGQDSELIAQLQSLAEPLHASQPRLAQYALHSVRNPPPAPNPRLSYLPNPALTTIRRRKPFRPRAPLRPATSDFRPKARCASTSICSTA